jgi:hypothetical protein
VAAAAALAMVGLIGLVDDLLNAMGTPVAPVIAGALVSLWWAARAARRAPAGLVAAPAVQEAAGWRPLRALVSAGPPVGWRHAP